MKAMGLKTMCLKAIGLKKVCLAVLAVCSGLALGAPAMAQEAVRIANIGHGYFSGPLYVAVREKLFEKHGLKPEITFVNGGPLALQAVTTGGVDFGVLSYEHILTAAARGQKMVAIFNVADRPLNNIVASNALVGASKGKTLAERVQALKGKRIGVPSAAGSGEKMLGVLAKSYGLALPGDIELVYLGSEPASYIGALKGKVIDAALPVEPAGAMVQQEGVGDIMVNIMDGEVPIFTDLIFMTVATLPETIRDKPDLARKVATVFSEAQAILLDPKRGPAIMAAEFPAMNPDTNARAYRLVSQIWSKNGRMTMEGAKKVYDFLQPGGQPVDFATTFTNELLPNNATQ